MENCPRYLSNSNLPLVTSLTVPAHFATALRQGDYHKNKQEKPKPENLSGWCIVALNQVFWGVLIADLLSHFFHSDGSFPMSQRIFPPSFWNSTYQPSSVPASLSSPLAAAAHSELPFAAATDPYAPASLHGHLHQGGPEPWHHAHHHHHHHHHHHPYIGTQSSAYPRPAAMHEVYGPHFDPRYGSLLVPTASVRPHRLTPASVPAPVSPPCELGKSEAGAAAAWTTPGPFPNATGDMAQSIGLNVDTARRYSFCGGSLLS
uniref:Uncharacterized protein n=1 Tax=Zonotrichia albicollis TaxID=44394 RepID=A0A8D2MEA0_ZONAL